MRITYVITRGDAAGGATVHVRELALAALGRGHEVLILVGGQGEATRMLTSAGLPVRILRHLRRPISPLRDWLAWREICRVLADWRPDLVSAHTAKAGWLGRAAAARLGIPALYTPHGLAAGDRISGLSGPAFALAERVAAPWGEAVVCVCEAEMRLALEKRIAPREKIQVIHNGVRDIPVELRAFPEVDPPRLAVVARMEAPKDFRTLVWALAGQRDWPWELLLVGDGRLRAQVACWVRDAGLSERVRFLGFCERPEQVLAGAQIFVLSSRSEALPRSLLEAMRAGLPVVATSVGGVPEAVADGVSGYLVPPQDPMAMGMALRRLITSTGERVRMGEAGRARYEQSFRLESMLDQTFHLYAKVQNRGPLEV